MRALMEKNLEYYLGLEYTMVIRHVMEDTGNYYYGKYVELEGCQSTADTIEELIKNLEEVKQDHIEIKLEFGDPIPNLENFLVATSCLECQKHCTEI